MYEEAKHLGEVQIEIDNIWGESLSLLSDLINLAELSIKTSDDWCNSANGLNELISMGCACIRQARAGLSLCRNGYADEAYAFCRPLWEKRVDVGFILQSGDAAKTLERYEDWDRARLLRFGLGNKDDLDHYGLGAGEKWHEVQEELHGILTKYDKHERAAVGHGDSWAKLSCDLGGYAQGRILRSVEERAKAIGAYDIGSQFRWMSFNGFVHLAPRAIQHGWSAPPGATVAAFATPFGLHMPITFLASTISALAATFDHDLPRELVPQIQYASVKRFGRELDQVLEQVLTTVASVPADFNPGYSH